jgi:hypothetical protein
MAKRQKHPVVVVMADKQGEMEDAIRSKTATWGSAGVAATVPHDLATSTW